MRRDTAERRVPAPATAGAHVPDAPSAADRAGSADPPVPPAPPVPPGRPATPAAPPDRRAAAGTVLWPLAVLALAHVALRGALGPARDLDILWRAGGRLLGGGPLYDPERAFIYPPVAGWVLAPLGALPFRTTVLVVTVLSVAALVAAVVLLLGMVGVPARSPVTAGVLLALSVSRPVDGLLHQGNVDVVLLLAQVVVMRCVVARRDVLAGVVLGAACAMKPTLAPLLLGTLLLGRVRTTCVAAGVGAALTVVGLLTVRDGGAFLTDVLPMLSDGNREVLHQYDKSLHGAAALLGVPDAVGLVARAAALAAAVAVAAVVARRRGDDPLAVMDVMPVLLLGGLLASSFSWANYSLYLLPLLVGVVRPGSVVRTWPAWAGVFLLWTADAWPALEQGETVDAVVGLRPTWGWLLLLAACAWSTARAAAGARRT